MFALRATKIVTQRKIAGILANAGRVVGRNLSAKIIYTETDEAPALATFALLPVVKKYCNKIGVDVVTRFFQEHSRN